MLLTVLLSWRRTGGDVSMDLWIAQGLNFLALILCPVFKQLLYSDEFERPGGAHPLREP